MRVSPWPIVFVAIRPKDPPGAKEVKRSAEEVGDQVGVAVRFFVNPSSANRDSHSRFPPISVFLPANGGLPTNASNPGFSRSNTSGNSISQ